MIKCLTLELKTKRIYQVVDDGALRFVVWLSFSDITIIRPVHFESRSQIAFSLAHFQSYSYKFLTPSFI